MAANIVQPRLRRVTLKAIVEEPYEVMIKLYNEKQEKNKKIQEMARLLFTTHLLHLESETETLNDILEYINNGFDEKATLKFVKENIELVKAALDRDIDNHQDIVLKLIEYYETKEDLKEHEKFGLEKLRQIRTINRLVGDD